MTSAPLKGYEVPGGPSRRFLTFEDALAAAVAEYWRNRPNGWRVADVPPKEARRDG